MPNFEDLGPRAWAFIVAGQNVNRGALLAYEEDPSIDYTWTNRVPNHAAIEVGDIVIIRSKKALLGASVIESIQRELGNLVVRSCPDCGSSNFKMRTTKIPPYRCHNCKTTFKRPAENIEGGMKYFSNHARFWVGLNDLISLADLRSCLNKPKSQLSLSRVDWNAFLGKIRLETDLQTFTELATFPTLQMKLREEKLS